MYVRISKYKLKPGSLDAAEETVKGLKSRIMALEGLHEFLNAADDDGNGYAVSVVENEEASESVQAAVAAIWQEFAEYLAGPPEVTTHRVIMHERN